MKYISFERVKKYLQFAKEPDHHTRLGLIYMESIKSLLAKNSLSSEPREKLLRLLKESKLYNENTMLAQVVSLPLYEEQIIVYTRVLPPSSSSNDGYLHSCESSKRH